MAGGVVIVTGASSGIGAATARHLRSLGFDVLAGVRNDEAAASAREAGCEPLRLDVTDADSIAAARAEVGERPLAGLVNNAGVAVAGPLELVPIDDLRRQLEINVVGQVAVTQAFIPALRAGRGRIVNVSSIGGRIALPLMGAYAASKFALEAISDSLRRELADQGIEVVVVEPGGVKTPIWEKGRAEADAMLEQMPDEAVERYRAKVDRVREFSHEIAERTGVEPEEVARAIGRALTERRPRTRYLVGRDARTRVPASKFVPDRVLDRMIAREIG
jgi:NAD(P)-dependent dehydrogenase (short-subunit alcohol dehydrogenase family)